MQRPPGCKLLIYRDIQSPATGRQTFWSQYDIQSAATGRQTFWSRYIDLSHHRIIRTLRSSAAGAAACKYIYIYIYMYIYIYIIRRAPQARACENFFQSFFHSSSSSLQAPAPLPSILHSSSSRSGCLQNLRNLYIGGPIRLPQAATGCRRPPQAATGCHRGLDPLALDASQIHENH